MEPLTCAFRTKGRGPPGPLAGFAGNFGFTAKAEAIWSLSYSIGRPMSQAAEEKITNPTPDPTLEFRGKG